MKTTVKTQEQAATAKVCFSYIRFSSRIQAKGDSERRQCEIAPRVAKEKGWILREDLNAADLGVSAFKGDNMKTLKAISEAVRAGKIPQGAVMIIEAFDRFSRADIDTAEDVLKDMLRAGLEIYVDRGGHHLTRESLNRPIDRIIALLELAAANEYAARLSDRVGKAWKQKKARAADGVKLTTMAPAWLDVDKEHNTITPNEKAEVVRRIFNSYANGKGIRTIMRELNADKIPTFGKGKQNRSKSWSNTHLRRILCFRGVIGEYQPCNYVDRERVPVGPPVTDYYPAVVDKATFYKVQEMLPKAVTDPVTGKKMLYPKSKTGKPRWAGGQAKGPKTNATNLFTGLVKCAKCGASMVIKQSPCTHGERHYHYTSLICSNALRGNGCDYKTIQYSWVERAILTTLWLKVLPVMAETDTRHDELAKLHGELKDVQAKLKIWADALDSAEAKPAIAMQKMNAYETKAKALSRRIESLSATIEDNPLTGWQQVPPTIDNRLRLQAVLANQIESLTLDAEKRTATLQLKEPKAPKGRFELAWNPTPANQVNKNEAATSFLLWGERQDYLDHVLVWKTPHSVKIGKVTIADNPKQAIQVGEAALVEA